MIFVLIRIVWEWLRRAGLPIPPLPRLGSRTSVLERLLLRPGARQRRVIRRRIAPSAPGGAATDVDDRPGA